MKLLIVALSLSLAFSLSGMAEPEKTAAKSETSVDSKTEKEILQMENQLRLAIEKCDEALLGQLLADYYTDSYQGSERASTKPGTIARCKAGKLFFLALDNEKQLSRSAEVVTIEGAATIKQKKGDGGDAEAPKAVHVQRRWTKKDGRWLLILQERRPLEDDRESAKEK